MLMEGAFSEMCPIGEHVTNTLQVRYSLATLSFMLPSLMLSRPLAWFWCRIHVSGLA